MFRVEHVRWELVNNVNADILRRDKYRNKTVRMVQPPPAAALLTAS